ncbi:uncharacterized protein B0T23DRAFT_426863 [Neurospora hispaniola]|uniref:Uncharacterized protein n=1 Tax=Neurospora hispaniola TaxID=588809 RepID=A0AAJ0IDK1_9PEZI|nr:hypothetical protein B0T23DRAFT_426863 [Neurospora hispaniola]
MDEFEHGDSHRADRSLVTASSSQFPPKTSHPKFSASPPNVPQHHYEKSDKRKTTSQRLHEMEDFPSKPILAPSFNNPTPHNSEDQPLPSPASEIRVERIAFDAVHDPSQSSKDISIQLDVPIEHDLSPYLEDFCRFRRLGRFKEARDIYQSKLAQYSTIPYIFIHYAEMLVVSGDYKSFQELTFPGLNEEKDPKSATDGKLKTNFELLKLVTRSPIWNYTVVALETVRRVLEDLYNEEVIGSTEIQILSLCLQVLSYLKASSHSQVVAQAIQDAKALLDLELLYYRLLSEARVWDFRDLLVSTVLLFGWLETIAMLFKTKDLDGAFARIHEDWAQLESSESVILGLLDVFTSLMLQIRPLDQGAELLSPTLVEHARVFAESVKKDNADNTKTRPFIQWILAKTWWETRPTSKRPDGFTINDFQGLLLEQGDGIHLPVFVPNKHFERPDWALVSARPNTAQREAVEVALGMAMEGNDLYLQALALKILCLQSPDPTGPMNVLSTVQLDLQGDMEGFLGTCLARYLVPQGQNEADEKELLRNFKQLDNVSGRSYLHSVVNPSFIWARDVIHGHIWANFTGKQTQTPDWAMNLRIYGPRLPQYVATFIEDHFRLSRKCRIRARKRLRRVPRKQVAT